MEADEELFGACRVKERKEVRILLDVAAQLRCGLHIQKMVVGMLKNMSQSITIICQVLLQRSSSGVLIGTLTHIQNNLSNI